MSEGTDKKEVPEQKKKACQVLCSRWKCGMISDVYSVYAVLKVHQEYFQSEIFLDSSMAEHSAVNRRVVGSSPTRGG